MQGSQNELGGGFLHPAKSTPGVRSLTAIHLTTADQRKGGLHIYPVARAGTVSSVFHYVIPWEKFLGRIVVVRLVFAPGTTNDKTHEKQNYKDYAQ
jgi:hypothetical protein